VCPWIWFHYGYKHGYHEVFLVNDQHWDGLFYDVPF
jgi:hypothetical protein